MARAFRRPSLAWLGRGRGHGAGTEPAALAAGLIPADPRRVLSGVLDPDLDAIRGRLRPHRRRLWLRRIVRRAWMVVAVVALFELGLWTVARVRPVEIAPALGAALPLVGLVALVIASMSARPSLGETALAVDREGGLGDRTASALALAMAVPAAAGPATDDELAQLEDDHTAPLDREAEERRFVRRQRRDALRSLGVVRRDLFRPRLSRQPAAAALVAMLVLAPVILLPNPQDVVIAQQREAKEEAKKTADKLDELADKLAEKGTNPNDPRTKLAQELRELARQLRENPGDLNTNLAKIGEIEASIRAQLDPANEQRAAALANLSRSLSRTASGNPNANTNGDPNETKDDLKGLGDKLKSMTDEELKDLAKSLSEMQGTATQANGAVAQALRDAAQSLGQGDTASAQEALDRLGEALNSAQNGVQTNRDLATAANRLQDSRRDLANAGQQLSLIHI